MKISLCLGSLLLLTRWVDSIVAFSTTVTTTTRVPVIRSTTARSAVSGLGSEESPSQRRRALWTGAAASLLLVGTAGTTQPQADGSSTNPVATPLSSLDEAIELIESSCDKRFLHAVVASDYQFLYQQGSPRRPRLEIQREEEDFSASPPSSLLADPVFSYLEEHTLRDRPLQPSNSRLVVSNKATVHRLWGSTNVVSVWPLGSVDGVHYAWPQGGGLFRTDSTIIVDGIDCGRESLEDSLEGDAQVLVKAERFLVIPQSMEQDLRAKLQGAFLI